MNYGPMPLQGDSESLQTDVMRFMAIIAFCLIAILALVKEATPASRTPTPMEITPPPEVMQSQLPAQAPEAPTATRSVSVPTPEPDSLLLSSAQPTTTASPRWEQPLPRPTQEPLTTRPTPKPDTNARQQPKAPPREKVVLPAVEASTTAASAVAADPVLSLRFASDNDFLRLIAKGEITVYAYHGPHSGRTPDREILKLDDNYLFRSSPAPGRVYELLPQTIPGLVVNALRTTGRDVEAFTWAIVLPSRIEQQLEQHLNRVRSGELVIDRFGEVLHVAPG